MKPLEQTAKVSSAPIADPRFLSW